MKKKPPAALLVADLVPDPQNRRAHPARNVEMITTALRRVGAARSIVIDEGNQVLAGNGVLLGAPGAGVSKVKVVDAEGDTIVAVRRRGLTAEQKRELAIYDNRTAELAEWNLEQVRADIDAGLDLLPFFTDAELRDLFPAEGREAHASLSDRFGVPPFTVLDARQGYWQDRKRAWLDLGIESELGRGENGTACPGGSAMPGVRGPRKDYKPGQSKPFKFKNAVPVNASADRGPKKTRGTYNDRAWIQSKGLKGLAQNTHVTPAKRKAATTAAPR